MGEEERGDHFMEEEQSVCLCLHFCCRLLAHAFKHPRLACLCVYIKNGTAAVAAATVTVTVERRPRRRRRRVVNEWQSQARQAFTRRSTHALTQTPHSLCVKVTVAV